MKSHIHPFPSKEADRHEYYNTVCPYLVTPANAARLGILSTNLTDISTLHDAYSTVFMLAQNPDKRTKTIVMEKNIADKQLQKLLRQVYNDLPKSKLTTQDRETLNLPERAKQGSVHHITEKVPTVLVDTANRLQHGIWVRDESSKRKGGKPKGVRVCQLWVKVGGAAPVSESELKYAGSVTRSPYLVHFDGNDAGKPAYYWARWENNRGQTGSWSMMIYATIGG